MKKKEVMMYTKEEQAIKFVIKVFESRKRIKEEINLSFHSISVGFMLKNIGCSEDVVVSGLLHDIIEDTEYDYQYIKDNYGTKIAENVLAVSENLTISEWKSRKEEFIERLHNQPDDILLVEVADKLHNLLSDYDLWKQKGNDALASKNASYEEQKWFYLELKKLFSKIKEGNTLLDRYNKICDIYFGSRDY